MFAPNELFLLNLAKGEQNANWIQIETEGPNPGNRFGHSLSFIKPYIVLFGGYFINNTSNDTWVLSIDQMPFKWIKINFENEIPKARVYHTASICTSGVASGMIIIFGGRDKDQIALADTWGLCKHTNGSWEWVKAPLNGNLSPIPRFQVNLPYISILQYSLEH